MGLVDKAREQASALSRKVGDGVEHGQEKLNVARARRNANRLLEELGAWEWADRNGRGDGRAREELDRIRAELAAHEATHGPIEPPGRPVADRAAAGS